MAEFRYKNAIIRVNLPEGKKIQPSDELKKATEIFVKKAMAAKAEKGNNERVANL